VFFGRFLLGLRVWASWLAGATHMRWRSFFLWNALGGICWATAIGLLAYFLGNTAGNVIEAFGLYGVAAVLIAIAVFLVAHFRARHRAGEDAADSESSPGDSSPTAVENSSGVAESSPDPASEPRPPG
jgi:membrane protein DedA with SNARE-associated domain